VREASRPVTEAVLAKSRSIPAVVASDVAANAASVAPAHSRSVAEQISHWARIGMHIERAGSVATHRVREVDEGREQFSTLGGDERTVAHAMVDARISELAAAQSFGAAGSP
jgi:hypothetical protein